MYKVTVYNTDGEMLASWHTGVCDIPRFIIGNTDRRKPFTVAIDDDAKQILPVGVALHKAIDDFILDYRWEKFEKSASEVE